jgi:hypothetical protein
MVPILTDEVIEAAMVRAERAACPPGDPRCYGFAYSVEESLAKMTPDGWVPIGWVCGNGGRQTWDAWFHLDTAEQRVSVSIDSR